MTLMVSLVFSSVSLAYNLDFVLVNNTGTTISQLYISPSSGGTWEDDMLDGQSIYDGGSKKITFSASDSVRAKYWDIEMIEKDGKRHVFGGINLAAIPRMVMVSDADNKWSRK